MRLTERTDSAFRVLMYLAINSDQRCSIDTIVEKCYSHRSQVVGAVQTLRKAGYISSSAGRTGGIWLKKAPGDIKISEIIQLMENDFQLAACFSRSGECRCAIVEVCLLRQALNSALGSFFEELDKLTLADIVANQRELKKAVGNRTVVSEACRPFPRDLKPGTRA